MMPTSPGCKIGDPVDDGVVVKSEASVVVPSEVQNKVGHWHFCVVGAGVVIGACVVHSFGSVTVVGAGVVIVEFAKYKNDLRFYFIGSFTEIHKKMVLW
jgi:hypothetical protein